MARLPRLDLPEMPQHIVQRGNNRGPCFFEERHRHMYLAFLRDAAGAADVAVHAYVLMTNHVHLLITPRRSGGMSALMQALGRRYVQSLNKLCSRTGTLFEGRFRSSLVQSDRYLLCCYRYIELNPVRAGLAADPAGYRWSSYRCNALGRRDDLITLHPLFGALGSTPEECQDRYRALVAEGLSDADGDAVRSHLRQGRALGSPEFQALVETMAGRRRGIARKGRPPRKKRT